MQKLRDFIYSGDFVYYNALYKRKSTIDNYDLPVICGMIVELRYCDHFCVWDLVDALSRYNDLFYVKLKDVLSAADHIMTIKDFVLNYEICQTGQRQNNRCIPIGKSFKSLQQIKDTYKDPDNQRFYIKHYNVFKCNWDSLLIGMFYPELSFSTLNNISEANNDTNKSKSTRTPYQNIKAFWVTGQTQYILEKGYDSDNTQILQSAEPEKIMSNDYADYDYIFKNYARLNV